MVLALARTVADDVATELHEVGYCTFPINEEIVARVRLLMPEFFNRRVVNGDISNWSFTIPTSHEFDVGVVMPNDPERDTKYFYHHNRFLLQQLSKLRNKFMSREDHEFVNAVESLYQYTCDLGGEIIAALDRWFDYGALSEYCRTCMQSYPDVDPYSLTTARSLYYPAGPEQHGARAHYDKSFITIHLGDQGGELIGFKDEEDDLGFPISPRPGEAIVFPGLKSKWVSRDELKVLRHKSITNPDQDRFAQVLFCHVGLRDYLMQDAKKGMSDFTNRFREALLSDDYDWHPRRSY